MEKLQKQYDRILKDFREYQEIADQLIKSGEALDERLLTIDIGIMFGAEIQIREAIQCSRGSGGSACPPICP